MRKTLLAALVGAMLLAPLHAQQAAQVPPAATAPSAPLPDDGIRTEATVVVTGEQPGPGLWLVRNGAHDLWILGTIKPLPTNMQWRTKQVDEVIANAQEVIYEPSLLVNSDIGKFRALMLLPSLVGVKNNPDGKRLDAVLPPTTYVRWSAFRDRFLDRDADKLRPMFAADALWKAAIKRSGMSDKDVAKAAVAAAVERHHPTVTLVKHTITVKDPKATIKQFKASNLEDVACLERTLDRLGDDMETLRERANAWASGEMARLRALPHDTQYESCKAAVSEAEIGKKIGYADAELQLQKKWLAAVDSALARNKVTFAVLDFNDMFVSGRYLAQLEARGYQVIEPDE